MTVGAITAGIGPAAGIDGIVRIQDATQAQNFAQAQSLAQAYTGSAQPLAPSHAGAIPAPQPQQEINRPATRNESLGERILDRLEAVHRGDKLRNGEVKAPSSDPVVKAASMEPGPAASALRELPTGREATTKAASQDAGQFKSMLEQLQQVYGQVIQVSVVSKSTGSFTSSMNRLMSSS